MNEIVKTIKDCCVEIHQIVANAPLANHHGDYNNDNNDTNKNASNDIVQKLDIISNNILIQHLSKLGNVYSLSSEELENELICNKDSGKYRIVFDPLDGSSNINAGIPTGTIWGIEDFATGEILRAGYAMYSSSLYFCDAFSKDVSLYIYNYASKTFEKCNEILHHTKKVKQYSINESNNLKWNHKINNYLNELKRNGYTQRWIGTMVADVHRTILYGGIFCYPEDSKSKNGKLRLVYECRPFAFIFQQLGKCAIHTSTLQPILEMNVKELHQKCGIIIGDRPLIDKYIICMSDNKKIKSKL